MGIFALYFTLRCNLNYFQTLNTADKQLLSLYPVLLFYTFITLFISMIWLPVYLNTLTCLVCYLMLNQYKYLFMLTTYHFGSLAGWIIGDSKIEDKDSRYNWYK